jgi:hypothetical protein
MASRKLTRDDRMDIAIEITNELITLGYVPDCTDTYNEDEFNVQEVIARILKYNKLRKKSAEENPTKKVEPIEYKPSHG